MYLEISRRAALIVPYIAGRQINGLWMLDIWLEWVIREKNTRYSAFMDVAAELKATTKSLLSRKGCKRRAQQYFPIPHVEKREPSWC